MNFINAVSSETFAKEIGQKDIILVKLAWNIFQMGSFDEIMMCCLCGGLHNTLLTVPCQPD